MTAPVRGHRFGNPGGLGGSSCWCFCRGKGISKRNSSSLSGSFSCGFLASHSREIETCEEKGARLTRIGFPKCAAAALACPMCGAASFSLTRQSARMQPFPDRNLTPRDAHPDSGHPKPLLPCRTLCVFLGARVCANACPAPALPRARQASSYQEAGQDQSLRVSLETNKAIREGRVTNHNGSVGSVR